MSMKQFGIANMEEDIAEWKAELETSQDKAPIGALDKLEPYDWPKLDPGIRHYVRILRSQGIETCQSCEGGPGHAYPEPTVDFRGGQAEGPRAVAACLTFGLPVAELRRTWEIRDGEMVGPLWAVTFRAKAAPA